MGFNEKEILNSIPCWSSIDLSFSWFVYNVFHACLACLVVMCFLGFLEAGLICYHLDAWFFLIVLVLVWDISWQLPAACWFWAGFVDFVNFFCCSWIFSMFMKGPQCMHGLCFNPVVSVPIPPLFWSIGLSNPKKTQKTSWSAPAPRWRAILW